MRWSRVCDASRLLGHSDELGDTEAEVAMSKNYNVVSGLVFGVVALGQASRALMQLPVHVGSVEIPVWASWFAAVVAGSLCVWAFRSKG